MTLRQEISQIRAYIKDGYAERASDEETKEWFVSPILRELGWVGPERVASGSRPRRDRSQIDYSLLESGRKALAAITVERASTDLDAGHAQLILSECVRQRSTKICVVTTGVQWWLYLPRAKAKPEERRFAALDLGGDKLKVLVDVFQSCLSYDALTGDDGERRAKAMLAEEHSERVVRAEIPHAVQRLLSKPDDLIVELVQEEVLQKAGLRPDSKQVADVLRRAGSTLSERTATNSQSSSAKRRSPKVKAVSLWGATHEVRYQYEVLTTVVDAVYARHADTFERALEIGQVQRGSSGLTRPYQIGRSDYFVERPLSSRDTKRSCERLLEAFGYDSADLAIVHA